MPSNSPLNPAKFQDFVWGYLGFWISAIFCPYMIKVTNYYLEQILVFSSYNKGSTFHCGNIFKLVWHPLAPKHSHKLHKPDRHGYISIMASHVLCVFVEVIQTMVSSDLRLEAAMLAYWLCFVRCAFSRNVKSACAGVFPTQNSQDHNCLSWWWLPASLELLIAI